MRRCIEVQHNRMIRFLDEFESNYDNIKLTDFVLLRLPLPFYESTYF